MENNHDGVDIILVDDNSFDGFLLEKITKGTQKARSVKKFLMPENAIDHLLAKKYGAEQKQKNIILLKISLRGAIMDGYGFLAKFNELPEDIKEHHKVFIVEATIKPAEHDQLKQDLSEYAFIESTYIRTPLTKELLGIIFPVAA